MRNIREILRLHFEAGLILRQISACTKASVGGVQKLLAKVRQANLSWPLPDSEEQAAFAKLESLLAKRAHAAQTDQLSDKSLDDVFDEEIQKAR